MIHGTVVGLQARINVIFHLPEGLNIEIGCVVDTEFEDFLTLAADAISKLGLPYLARIDANLADNSNVPVIETILYEYKDNV